ncbi:hypothetical protein Ocin01_01275 [Orchesella cincta]|uniref:Uncharacterized protein n=1 Tax=Orchesella cincta TaxID=48709 RepID=A0A1D2NJH3_ORCCI|nr:hypothetical protein Ocin01_01275 [Orchesella cincta]
MELFLRQFVNVRHPFLLLARLFRDNKLILVFLSVCLLTEWCQCAPGKWKKEDYRHRLRIDGIDSGYPERKVHARYSTTGIDNLVKVNPSTQKNTISKRATTSNMDITPEKMQNSTNNPVNFDLGNATAIGYAVNGFIRSAEGIIRELLISTQSGLLRMIGQVDQGLDGFQKRLQNTSFRLTLSGQKAAAQAYEALPPFVNTVIQRIGTAGDARSREQFNVQLNEVVNNLRENRKQFFDAFEEHEHDFHAVFQDRFTQINQYLRVPELPKRSFGWY